MILHIENSRKLTQWCRNFTLATATWRGRRPSTDCHVSSWKQTRHFCDNGARLQEGGHAARGCWNSTHGCVIGVRTVLSTRRFSCYWTKLQKNVVLKGQDWQILRQVSPTQSHQSNDAAEKAVSTVRGLARTYLAVIKDKIASFDVKPFSPTLPWTIRHAAWVLTRYNERRYREEILPWSQQVLARRPRANNVNQILQPWVAGLWLGRDTLSDEHLVGTSAGVMRSRAVRRLQEPARWVPEALQAMLFTPWAPRLNVPGRPRLQRPAYEEPVAAGAWPIFIEIRQPQQNRNHSQQRSS